MSGVDIFTREEFEAALPVHKDSGKLMWQYGGLDRNEHIYHIPVSGTNKRITVRSSVKGDGVSAGTGEDSIRLWVSYFYPKAGEWFALGKLDAWTTRVPGWQHRMTEKLRKLYQLALEDSNGRRTSGANDGKNEKIKGQKPTPSLAPEEAGASGPEPKRDSVAAPASQGTEDGPSATSSCGTPSQSKPSSVSLSLEQSASIILLGDNEPMTEPREPNAEQYEAIEAPVDAAVRVLAPPGSGKTFALARRYAYLLENGAEPVDILAVTFSKGMADELLSCIMRVSPDVEGTEAEQQVCTIHAACYRMLKADGDKRRVPKTWKMKKALQDIAEKLWPYSDERPGWEELISWINRPKYAGLPNSEDLDFYTERLGGYDGRNLHEARRQFDQQMKQQGFLTFADMLFDTEQKLLRDRIFQETWQARYKWLIVDEGQDTSGQAMRILATLAEPQNRFFIVGDTDQLLYRFAGATPEANLYKGFEKRYPDGLTVKLSVNYRSTQAIIAACENLIAHNYASGGGPYEDRYRKDVIARPGAPEGTPPTFSEYETADDEAVALVESLREAMADGRKPGDFFVGARTRAQLGYLEGPLTRVKIPFINATGGSFWASKHVADVVAYLALAYDASNEAAFKRVYNVASNWNTHPWGDHKGEYCQHRYLGRAFLEACGDSYSGVWQAAGRRRSFEPGVNDLTQFIDELKGELACSGPAKVLQVVIDDCYKKYLKADQGITSSDEAENGKLEDLATAVDVASQFEDVGEFLDYVRDAIKASQAAKNKDWGEYVVISTVHRLKGLERSVVYGVGVSEGELGSLLPHTFSLMPPPQNGVLPTGGMGRVSDERCIAFVLCSRAQEEVHLSGIREYRRKPMARSRFVSELS